MYLKFCCLYFNGFPIIPIYNCGCRGNSSTLISKIMIETYINCLYPVCTWLYLKYRCLHLNGLQNIPSIKNKKWYLHPKFYKSNPMLIVYTYIRNSSLIVYYVKCNLFFIKVIINIINYNYYNIQHSTVANTIIPYPPQNLFFLCCSATVLDVTPAFAVSVYLTYEKQSYVDWVEIA